jgi:microsomal epoxide hydrolase
MMKKFKIDIPEEKISKIKEKVKNYPWNSIPNLPDWEHGTNLSYLKEICDYWIKDFDWRFYENKINSFENFKTNVDGIDIHFIKKEGSGSNPKIL